MKEDVDKGPKFLVISLHTLVKVQTQTMRVRAMIRGMKLTVLVDLSSIQFLLRTNQLDPLGLQQSTSHHYRLLLPTRKNIHCDRSTSRLPWFIKPHLKCGFHPPLG